MQAAESAGVRPSTLRFLRSMRESNAPIHGMCVMTGSGNVVTHDDKALRLWSLSKQLKAHHLNAAKLENLKFARIYSIDELQCFVVIYSLGKSVPGAERGGCMRVFSEQLELLQEVELKLPPIEKVQIANNQQEILVLDKVQCLHVIHLDIVGSPPPRFSKDKNSHRDKGDDYSIESRSLLPPNPKTEKFDYNPKPKVFELVKLYNIQRIDCKQVEIQDVIMLSENTVMVLTGANLLMVLTRPMLRHAKEEVMDDGSISSMRKKKALEVKKRREIEENGGQPLPEKEFHDFIHTASLVLKYDALIRRPVMIRHFQEHMLFLGYNDGWVQVVQFSDKLLTLDPEETTLYPPPTDPFPTMVLAEFQAHYADATMKENDKERMTEGPFKIGLVSPLCEIFDATKCRTFGPSCFFSEFFTLGTDLRIVHWGLRYTVSALEIEISRSKSSSSTSYSFDRNASMDEAEAKRKREKEKKKKKKKKKQQTEEEEDKPVVYVEEISLLNPRIGPIAVEFLGDYILQDSSPSDVSLRLKADTFLRYLRLKVVHMSADNEGKPVSLQVMGNYGGSIVFWEILQPHGLVYAWKSPAVSEEGGKRLDRDSATPFDLEQLVRQAVRGPDLQTGARSFTGQSLLDYVSFIPRDTEGKTTVVTALFMKGDNLDVINTTNGERIQTIPLNHIADVRKENMLSQSLATTGVLDRDLQAVTLQRESEVRPTCVHYCPHSQFIVVGYQTGVVGVMNFHAPILTSEGKKRAKYSYLRSNKVHLSDITLIKTFPFKFHPYANVGISTLSANDMSAQLWNNEIVVALVGDAQGVISLWQIHPQRKSKSPLLFHNRQHLGKIVHATLVHVPGHVENTAHPKIQAEKVDAKGILVTACDRGVVYAWRVESNLELQMIAHFNTTQSASEKLFLTSLTVIPKMVYRTTVIAKPAEKTILSSLSTYMRLKGLDVPAAEEDHVELAVLHYELYCLVGFSDGGLDVWNISTDAKMCSSHPLLEKQDYLLPLVSLTQVRTTSSNPMYHQEGLAIDDHVYLNTHFQKLPNNIEKEFVLVNQISSSPMFRLQEKPPPKWSKSASYDRQEQENKEYYDSVKQREDFLPVYNEDLIMAAHHDGTVMMYRMRVAAHELDPELSFSLISTVKLPCSITTILPLSCPGLFANDTSKSLYEVPVATEETSSDPSGKFDREFLVVSDFEANRFLPIVSKDNVLPLPWSQPVGQLEQYLMIRSLTARGNYRKDELVAKLMSLQRLYAPKHHIPKPNRLPVALIGVSSTKPGIAQRPRPFTDTLRSDAPSGAEGEELHAHKEERGENAFELAEEEEADMDEERSAAIAAVEASGFREIDQDPSMEGQSHAMEMIHLSRSLSTSMTSASGQRRQYVGPMETMQRIMSSDLHFAKKDKRLLELFVQNADNNGSYLDAEKHTVRPEQAVEIVCQWMNEDRADSSLKCYLKGFYQAYTAMHQQQPRSTFASSSMSTKESIASSSASLALSRLEIKRENLQELFKLLEIQPTDRLKFIEVAKVAAITASALQRSLSINREDIASQARNNYKTLRSTKTKVSYNSMGERVVEKITVSEQVMGVPSASTDQWRKTLYATVQQWRAEKMTLPLTVNASSLQRKRIDAANDPVSHKALEMSTAHSRPRLLQSIPSQFQSLLRGGANLTSLLKEQHANSPLWTEEDVHYFDILRTIRTVRALFDMRSVRQYELCQSTSLPTAQPEALETMPQLVVKYFERQFGEAGGGLNVSRHKIANFLEACLQYADFHPLVNVMRKVLRLNDSNEGPASTTQMINERKVTFASPHEGEEQLQREKTREVALWLVTEVRNLLSTRNAVVLGTVIDKKFPFEPHDPLFAFTAISDVQSSQSPLLGHAELINLSHTNEEIDVKQRKESTVHHNNNRVRWLYIAKADAIHVADEMFRTRAKLGPQTFMTVFAAIEGLPLHSIRPPTLASDAPPLDHMVNMEKYLLVLYDEFLAQCSLIRKTRELVFGEYCKMNVASSAIPRDINGKPTRPLIIDDIDQGFGSYHPKNLSRIQDLLHICIALDPLRTGELAGENLEEILMQHWLLPTPHSFDVNDPLAAQNAFPQMLYSPKRYECKELINTVQKKLRIKSIEDKVAYIDMIALLLSWEEHQQGHKRLSIPELLSSLPGILRTIELSLARELVQYFTTVSASPDFSNPLWVMGVKAANNPFAESLSHLFPQSIVVADSVAEDVLREGENTQTNNIQLTGENAPVSLSLPLDGVWRPVTSVPDDNPGMLHVQSAVFYPPEQRNPNLFSGSMKTSSSMPALHFGATHGIVFDEHQREMSALNVPQVLHTTRVQTSVLGESIKLNNNPFVKPEQTKIRITRLDGDILDKEKTEVRAPYSAKNPKILKNNTVHEQTKEEVGTDEKAIKESSDSPNRSAKVRSSYSRVLENFTTESLCGPLEATPPPPLTAEPAMTLEEDSQTWESSAPPLTPAEYAQQQQHGVTDPDNTLRITFRALDNQSTSYGGMLQEGSLDSLDSNYQHYDLALTSSFPRTPPDHHPLLLTESRPITRAQAALTPFLDFAETDIAALQRPLVPPHPLNGGHSQSQASLESQSLVQSMNRSLASEDISKRIHDLQVLESQFYTMYEAEKEEFERRRMEKEKLREEIRREMLWKQRQAMEFYHKEQENRQRRLDKGRELLRQSEELEMQDKMAKELEIQALLELNKAKTQQRLQEKAEGEMAKKQREKEEKERALMKKEEKASAAMNAFYREQTRNDELAKKKAAEDEMAEFLKKQKEMQREQEEAEAAARAALATPQERPESPEQHDEKEEDEEDEEDAEDGEEVVPRGSRRRRLFGDMGGDEEDEDDEEEAEENEEIAPPPEETEQEVADDTADEENAQRKGLANDKRDYHMTLTEKIMQRVFDNIDEAYRLFKSHPRNKHEHGFFMPLVFSPDIHFNSFESFFNDLDPMHLSHSSGIVQKETQSNNAENDEDSSDELYPTDPFADIKTAVKKHRRRMDKQRKALFKTEAPEVSVKDWTPVFRNGYADWKAFFTNEKRKKQIMDEIIEQVMDDDDFELEKPPQPAKENTPAVSHSSSGFVQSTSWEEEPSGSLGQIPPSLLQSIPKDVSKDIIPLPFGKVMKHQIVFPNEIKFYQLEVTDANVILTIELKCRKGLASGFFNFAKLPTTVKYLYKISCTKQNNRFARLSVVPEKGEGKYFFAVHSFDSGAEYDVWAYASGDKDEDFHPNPTIERVSKVLTKWEHMLGHSEEELQTHFPRIEAEARSHADKVLAEHKETLKNKHSVVQQMRDLMQKQELQSVLDDPSPQLVHYRQSKEKLRALRSESTGPTVTFTDTHTTDSSALAPNAEEQSKEMTRNIPELFNDEKEFLEEMENVEDFVVKVGRFAMKRSREILQQAKKSAKLKTESTVSFATSPSTASSGDGSELRRVNTVVDHMVDQEEASLGSGASVSTTSKKGTVPFLDVERAVSPTLSFSRSKDADDHDHSRGILLHSVNDPQPKQSHSPRDFGKLNRELSELGDELENPNQHPDLFSAPMSNKIASLNMIMPFHRENSRSEAKSAPASMHNNHEGHHPRRRTIQEIQRVLEEENEAHKLMDKTMANLPHLPGFSLKFSPSVLAKQQRYNNLSRSNESAFVGDNSLMSSTSSVLVKLPPINEARSQLAGGSPLYMSLNSSSQDTTELLRRNGELSDRSTFSNMSLIEKELADIANRKRPKVLNPLLMSSPKPQNYNLKRHNSSKFY